MNLFPSGEEDLYSRGTTTAIIATMGAGIPMWANLIHNLSPFWSTSRKSEECY